MDTAAPATYNKNLNSDCFAVKLDPNFQYPEAEIIIGGPAYQPFSVGGHKKGIEDARDGVPLFIDTVKNFIEPYGML